MVTEVRAVQPENALAPMLVTELGIVTEVRPVQPENAPFSMFSTELGIVTEVRPVQSLNAFSPMLVTELGMVIEVRPMQPENASTPMRVTGYCFPSYSTLSGITTSPVRVPPLPTITVAPLLVYSRFPIVNDCVGKSSTIFRKSFHTIAALYFSLQPKGT